MNKYITLILTGTFFVIFNINAIASTPIKVQQDRMTSSQTELSSTPSPWWIIYS